jgi:quercetin dioxygenase-like cupin family protein
VINAGVLLEGQLKVVTEAQKRLHLQAGDAVVEVVDQWHYGMNAGTEPAEIIVFYALKNRPEGVRELQRVPGLRSENWVSAPDRGRA